MFRLMEKARKNDKGFSLVELIVVVLIIAIIAVALAPQVVKYVKTARDNVELNNEATIKSAVQAAVAEYEGQIGVDDLKACAFYVDSDKSKIKSMTARVNTAPLSKDAKTLEALIQENLGSDDLDQNYGVEIDKNGVVTVTAQGSTTKAPGEK